MFHNYRFARMMSIVALCVVAFFGVSSVALAAPLPQSSFPPPPHRLVRFCPRPLGSGFRGDDVRRIQIDLDRQGFRGPDGRRLAFNGFFDQPTLFAVRQFELRHRFPVDGRVGPDMWQWFGECSFH